MPKLAVATVTLCLAVLFNTSQASATPLRVVVTFSILGDLVRNVSGEGVVIHTLVGPDVDAHTFEPSPADGVALAHASLIVENGLGFEPWLNKLCTAARARATRVVVSNGLALLRSVGLSNDKTAQPGEVDPHVWHDVTQAISLVHTIREALTQADPAQASLYQTNAARYVADLHQLDTWIEAQVQTLPRERRRLVTSHDTFGYFARRYGFDLLGAVLASFSTEAADPSGAELARLVETIKQAGVPAIFAENVQNPRLLRQVATVARVRLAPPLYTDALGKPGSAGESYITMMRYNVSTIVQALRP
jgi:zinc/manganese transport system substrate-binding protein